MIPLLDLKIANEPRLPEIEEAVLRVVRSGRYILGPELEKFESEWASYCGVKHCVGTANALEALEILLRCHGVGPGHEVIVPSNTYIATWLAVTHCGAKPIPVEPDPITMNLDPARVEAAITMDTKAVLAVHLYGLPAKMPELFDICHRNGIFLFADAAQAHGAKINGRNAAQFGDGTAFSFYPSKNLGGMGDAGCLMTNSYEIAAKARRMRNYGGVGRLDHTMIGINSRLDEIQAAILSVKLKYLDEENKKRRNRAMRYLLELPATVGVEDRWVDLTDPRKVYQHAIQAPFADPGHAWHQFVIRVEKGNNNSPARNLLSRALRDAGVDTHIHYPVPPFLEDAYKKDFDFTGREKPFPVAEKLASEVLSLPIGYEFDQDRVIEAFHASK